MIHRSRYPDPVIPDASLPGYVLAGAAAGGDRPALIDGVTGETVTYRELDRAVSAGIGALAGEGVGPGQVVALVGPNRPAWAVAFLAVLAAGSAVTPVNPALTAAEIGGQLRSSGAGVVVADAAVAAKVQEAVGAAGCRVLDLDALVVASRTPGVVAAVDPAALAVVPFSSGTTGLPKGVMLTHRNVVACLCQHEHLYAVGPDDVFLAALPFFHIYGMSIVLSYGLRHGATIVTLPRFDPARYRALIGERRVTWLHLVPPVVLLLGADEFDADLSSVRHAVSGAAPIDERALARAEARVGCRIGQGYGMTEASPGVTWVPDDGGCPAGSVGYLVGGTEARLVDPATGADTDGAGELWVRGPQVMAGYLDDPGATAATIVEDGWLRTGDILRVDGERGVVGRRPAQGADQVQGLPDRPGRAGSRAPRASRHRRRRGCGRRRPRRRRDPQGVRGRRGRPAHPGRGHGLVRDAGGALQEDPGGRAGRRDPPLSVGQDPAARPRRPVAVR